MELNHDLVSRIKAKLRACDDPQVRHDARNLLTVYLAMVELSDCSEEAGRRVPALENKVLHFIETGELLKCELTNTV